MDVHEIASAIAASAPAPAVRLRQGKVTAIAADGTITVQIGGDTTTDVAGVKCLASVCPIIGAGVWLATDGMDLFAIGTILPTAPAFCSITRTNDGTLATGTWYELSFASNTRTDPLGMWSAGAADRLSIPTPGVYMLSAQCTWASNATGRRDLRILVSGGTAAQTYMPAAPSTSTTLSVATLYELAAGDYVQLGARQSSGGDLLVTAGGDGSIRLAVQWLRGPA